VSPVPGVARLFVGLPVPPEVALTLERLGPRAQEGVRPIPAADMHITLHFLGGMEVAPVRECLRGVKTPAFSLRLGSPGSFAPRGKRRVLWVGVLPAAELVALHGLTGEALGAVGFEPEQRPFRPHITVARLKARAPEQIVGRFENQSFTAAGLEFECCRFGLFQSETAPEGARYSLIDSYSLGASD
jgi:2'-5' RNA ligase